MGDFFLEFDHDSQICLQGVNSVFHLLDSCKLPADESHVLVYFLLVHYLGLLDILVPVILFFLGFSRTASLHYLDYQGWLDIVGFKRVLHFYRNEANGS